MEYVWAEFEAINVVGGKLDTLKIKLIGDDVVTRTAIMPCGIDGEAGVLDDVSNWNRDRCIEYAEVYAEANNWKQDMAQELNNKVVF